MSVLTLPEPARWPAGRPRLMRAALAIGALSLSGIAAGSHRIMVGDYLAAVVAFSLVVPFAVTLFAMSLVHRGHMALRALHDRTGTILRPDKTLCSVLLVVIVLFIPIGVLIVVLTLTGDLKLFDSGRAQVGAMVLAGSATVIAIGGLLSAWRRGGIGYVKLTPSGIDVANIVATDSVEWDDVVAINDHSDTTKKTRKAVVLRRSDGTEKIIDGADFYVPDGVGLYWMVWHYWRHPEDRAELTDGRALARLENGRFDTTAM